MTLKLSLNAVVVTDRHRADLGDVAELAASIKRVGLLHPIVVTEEGHLIAGQRRLEAYRLLGRKEIETTIAADLDSASALLEAERDENTCRLDMKPSEKVALGIALEELERPKAAERERAGRAPSGPGSGGSTGHETRETVGAALGMSGTTYDRAKRVIRAKEDPDPEVRVVAEEQAQRMDETGNIRGAADSVSAVRRKDGKQPIARGNALKSVERFVSLIANTCAPALDLPLAQGAAEADAETRARWEKDLTTAIRTMTQIRRRIK